MLLLTIGMPLFAQQERARLSQEEGKLYDMIMSYRKSLGLPSIPLSNSLTQVAQAHCHDLFENKPDLAPGCNAHSWSDQGIWSACCYTPDHAQAQCMWNKPREIAEYPATGFEIACGSSEPIYIDFVMTADYALKSWQESPGHNMVLANLSSWKGYRWRAIGIGIYQGFACVWFGDLADPQGEAERE